MKKRVGVWIRVSTKLQQNSDSPEHHLQKAKMYAELKEWEIGLAIETWTFFLRAMLRF